MRRGVLEGQLGRELAVYCPWEMNSMYTLADASSDFRNSSYRSEPGRWDMELHLFCFAETRGASCARGVMRSSRVGFRRLGAIVLDAHQSLS